MAARRPVGHKINSRASVWAASAVSWKSFGGVRTLRVLSGKPVADAIREDVRTRAEALASSGRGPVLATLRCGDGPDDAAYERSIAKAAAALGVEFRAEVLPASVSRSELEGRIGRIAEDAEVDGMMLFRPLPPHLDEAAACDMVPRRKDVDCASASSMAGVFMGSKGAFAPATAEACVEVLDHYGISLEGAHALVVGRSLVVGKPVGMLMLGRDATVTCCHSRTRGLPGLMRQADVVVCAVGKAGFFGPDCFRGGQVVLDVGMNAGPDGALCGDVDYDAVAPVVAALTPVPGGIGSVTTSLLLRHVVEAAERERGFACL